MRKPLLLSICGNLAPEGGPDTSAQKKWFAGLGQIDSPRSQEAHEGDGDDHWLKTS